MQEVLVGRKKSVMMIVVDKIAMTLCLVGFLIVALIIMAGCLLDFFGYYEREQQKTEKWMENEEFEYGHNVRHESEDINQ